MMKMPEKKSALLFLAKRGEGEDDGDGKDAEETPKDESQDTEMTSMAVDSVASAIAGGNKEAIKKGLMMLVRLLKS